MSYRRMSQGFGAEIGELMHSQERRGENSVSSSPKQGSSTERRTGKKTKSVFTSYFCILHAITSKVETLVYTDKIAAATSFTAGFSWGPSIWGYLESFNSDIAGVRCSGTVQCFPLKYIARLSVVHPVQLTMTEEYCHIRFPGLCGEKYTTGHFSSSAW